MKTGKYLPGLVFLLSGLILLIFNLNHHRKYSGTDYRSTFFSDRAGHYIYLPATFLWKWDLGQCPKYSDNVRGNGFKLDTVNNKIITKYPLGAALMNLPFFLAAHLMAGRNARADAFSAPYEWSVILASIFYGLLGCWLIFQLLKKYVSPGMALTTAMAILWCSNLIHYTVADAGASHVYSFFCIALLMFFHPLRGTRPGYTGFFLAAGLAVSTRLILGLFLLPLILEIFYHLWKNGEFARRIPAILLAALPMIPLLLYWWYLGDAKLYEGESFSNRSLPKITEVLFAARNGWLLNHPVWLWLIPGLLFLLRSDRTLAIVIATSLVLCILSYASWYDPGLGCGFGHRGFTDLFALLAIPLAFGFNRIRKQWLLLILLMMAAFNLWQFFHHVTCFGGNSPWDYGWWWQHLQP